MELWQHQRDGVAFLAQRRTAYLNWEPRVGKTATAICAAEEVKAKRILVLCPAVAKENWRRDFLRWQVRDRPIYVVHGLTGVIPKDNLEPCVVIANYDLISREDSLIRGALMRSKFDVLVLDECHYLKGLTLRTRAVFGKKFDGAGALMEVCNRVWCLSGTPAPNHYGELYPVLRALHPDAVKTAGGHIMNRAHFEDEFCQVRVHPRFGRAIQGSKNGQALKARLEGWMDHKKRKDVVANLPPVLIDTVPLSPHDLPGSFLSSLREAEKITSALLGDVEDQDLLTRLSAAHVEHQRVIAGMCKAELIAPQIAEALSDAPGKVVVFAVHRDVLQALVKALWKYNPAVVHGGTSPAMRQDAIDRFEHASSCRVFVGQITAAGTAISLAAADDVYVVEPSWTPADNVQAISRVVNLGKSRGVTVRFITLVGSIDERITRVLAQKTADLAVVFDN